MPGYETNGPDSVRIDQYRVLTKFARYAPEWNFSVYVNFIDYEKDFVIHQSGAYPKRGISFPVIWLVQTKPKHYFDWVQHDGVASERERRWILWRTIGVKNQSFQFNIINAIWLSSLCSRMYVLYFTFNNWTLDIQLCYIQLATFFNGCIFLHLTFNFTVFKLQNVLTSPIS